MLRQAFNALARVHSRAVTLKRLGSPDLTTACRITPSNYFRFLEGPSSSTIHGREFIIPVDSIATPFPAPIIKRTDKIIHDLYGHLAIDEVIEMVDIGGAVIAYRVRTD